MKFGWEGISGLDVALLLVPVTAGYFVAVIRSAIQRLVAPARACRAGWARSKAAPGRAFGELGGPFRPGVAAGRRAGHLARSSSVGTAGRLPMEKGAEGKRLTYAPK